MDIRGHLTLERRNRFFGLCYVESWSRPSGCIRRLSLRPLWERTGSEAHEITCPRWGSWWGPTKFCGPLGEDFTEVGMGRVTTYGRGRGRFLQGEGCWRRLLLRPDEELGPWGGWRGFGVYWPGTDPWSWILTTRRPTSHWSLEETFSHSIPLLQERYFVFDLYHMLQWRHQYSITNF